MAKKLLKQSVAWITSMAIMLTAIFVPLPRAAAEEAGTVVGAFTVTGGTNGTDYTYDETAHVLTVSTVTAITIANTDPSTPTTDTIVVASASGANITLAGVNIDVSTTSGSCAFKIADVVNGDVTITLADGSENVLKSGYKCAGLQKDSADTYKLEITTAENTTGKLTATGGTQGAGIGGGNGKAGTNITISGNANVIATGGYSGAGIGGGDEGSGTDITISCNANVIATGGYNGAGIGGGYDGNGETITISDNAVVTATGGYNGAGIGGGNTKDGTDITISGNAVVTATGGEYGAGIGGGYEGNGESITISGGSVKAIAGNYANNTIGGGYNKDSVYPTNGNEQVYLLKIINADNEAVTIGGTAYTPASHMAIDYEPVLYAYVTGDNKIVTVGNSTRNYIFDIGTKTFTWENAPDDLTITADEVTLTDDDYTYENNVLTIKTSTAVTVSGITFTDTIEVDSASGANITLDGLFIDISETPDRSAFNIVKATAGKVTITLADGSANTLKSGESCAGLQKESAADYKLEITTAENTTGRLIAAGGENGAGIGGGYYASGSNIAISGGIVTAIGGEKGAGIGGGNDGSGSNITISGNTVVSAAGGTRGAGIGGGYEGNGENITISGNTVVSAAGGTRGAGIGGGHGGNAVVTAIGGYNGAGIGGGGERGDGSNIAISGGTVTATGGAHGAGIGGGRLGSGSSITISGGTVTATGGTLGAGIGGGYEGNGESITISGGTVTAKGGYGGAGIGGGRLGRGSTITISGSTVTATGGNGGAGIGGGNSGTASDIKITGGSVKAEGSPYTYNSSTFTAPAIGSGCSDSSNGAPLTPTLDDGVTNVYLLTINNADDKEVYIDGSLYNPKNHKSADPDDGNLYVYLTGTAHTVKLGADGEETVYCCVDNDGVKMFEKANLQVAATPSTDPNVANTIEIGTDYTYENGVLTILSAKAITIKNAEGVTTTTDRIVVKKDVTANITLAGVNIDVSGTNNACAFDIEENSTGNVKITLADGTTNTLISGGYRAGLQKNGISADARTVGTLTVEGSGALIATGGTTGAGIGGGYEKSTENITIGGSVTIIAAGTGGGSGIGGGSKGNVTENRAKGSGINITIKDNATVTARGSARGAGIGGGTMGGICENIIISGGSVKAEGEILTNIKTPDIGNGVLDGYTAPVPVAPTDGNGNKVYLLEIDTNGKSVYIDGKLYPLSKHGSEDKLYVYLKDAAHTVKLGADGEEVEYKLCGTGADAKFKVVPKAEDFTFSAPANLTYNGSSIEATVTTDVAEIGAITVKYYDESDTELNGAPVVPGNYTVKIDVAEGDTYANAEGITAESWKFTIIKATPDSPDETSFTLDLTVDSNNTYTATINTDLSGVEYSFDGTTWSNVNSKTGIAHNTTVTAYVRFKETNEYYASSSSSGSVTTAHGNVTSEWSKDAQGHWHACANCPNDKLDFAQHTSSGAATVGKAETCTICGYEISPAIVATPVIDPNGGAFTGSQTVTITCATDGATIYYTTDGSAPTTASTQYTGAFSITDTKTIKAIAVKDGMADSTVTTATFTKKSSGGGNGGGHSSNYPISTNPTINGVSKSWSDIANELSKLAVGSEITIDLNGNYEVPVEVIKAIADKNLKVTFVIDSWRSWTIDGADIEKPAAADFSAIQLPSSVIDGSSLRGTAGARLRIDGTNNPATLKVSFNKKYAGQFANLYRKDGDKLVFVDTVKIDENGSAQLEISEGGDYIFMLCEYSDRPGDMNNDGKLTAADASTMLKYIVRLINDGNVQMADLNGDGKINARDAVIVLKKVVGLE